MSPTPANPHLTRRYHYPDQTSTTLGIMFGILTPAFIICAAMVLLARRHEKRKKRKLLEETIHRQIHLHPAICSSLPGIEMTTSVSVTAGTKRVGSAQGPSGIGSRSGLPDHVLRDIVRDVQRELARVQPAASRGGRRVDMLNSCQEEDVLPAYEPRRDA